MEFAKYKALHIQIKKYLTCKYDPQWFINSNFASCKRHANKLAQMKGKSMIADAIIFYHYYDKEYWVNCEGNKARFSENEFSDFRKFIHKKRNFSHLLYQLIGVLYVVKHINSTFSIWQF